MSRYIDSLIDQAQAYWSIGEEIPLDLFSKLAMAGVDVVTLEKNRSIKTKGKRKNGNTI